MRIKETKRRAAMALGWTAEQCNAWLPGISFVLPLMGSFEEDLNP